MLEHWLLDPGTLYLNHGTVGATPRCVLAAQQAWRDRIERNPARFMIRELSDTLLARPDRSEAHLRLAAREVGSFVGARGEDLVFVDNSTTAVNAILRSYEFRADDELLLFDHGYGAIQIAARSVAARHGANVRCVQLPYPAVSEDAVVRALEDAITPRTRVAIIDHVTSPSALVLPIARLAQSCRKRGVDVLVDGAHAPGAIALDIANSGADWYTGNLHKWCWAPRSCALLWVNPARQSGLHAATISWGFGQGIAAEFDWPGTRDPTPHLSAPDAIAWMRELGVERVQSHNHELAWQAGQLLARAWKSEVPAPQSMVGTMVTVQLPAAAGSTQEHANRLRSALLFEDGIEIQMFAMYGAVWARVSAQVYNELEDAERLAQAVLARVD